MSHVILNKLGALCGPLSIVLIFAGLPGAGFLPPPSPSLTAEEIVDYYNSHKDGIQAMGTLLSLLGITWVVFVSIISGQISRIPGLPRTVSYIQLIGGCSSGLYMTLSGYLFLVTTYRPDRSPELILLLNDIACIIFLMPYPSFVAQDLAFSYAILQDHRPSPLFPHWIAYTNTALTVFYWTTIGIPFVHHGVASWNGALGFWVPAVVVGVNLCIVSLYVFIAAGRMDLPVDGERAISDSR